MIKSVSFVEHTFDSNATDLINKEIVENIDTPFLIGEMVYVTKSYKVGNDFYESINRVKVVGIQVNFYMSGINIIYEVTNGKDNYYVEAKDISRKIVKL
jgi:hypothetical protein